MGELVPEEQQRQQQPVVARRDMRVSDEDRHAVVDELRVHFSLGRIDLAELEDRVTGALEAKVRGDLEPLLTDLPELRPTSNYNGPPIRERDRPEGEAFRAHFYLWAVLSVFFVVIWAGTAAQADGDVPFWPVFPIAGIGLTVGVHAALRKATEN
ncbi:MAG TPA: DUF1707 domain-containing protein [Acidimicrobiales bacterium]|nr:DUF1707 domain-containing protein [Acidimicrobiales bacterium]